MRMTALILVVVTCVPVLVAQQPTDRFDVVSVKPNTSGGNEHSDVEPSGRVVITNMSLANLVRGVFDVQRHELVVGDQVPSWFASDRWDITAQGPPLTPDAGSQQRVRTMMRNMLVDRFKLVTTREVRDTPVYALVVARTDRRLGPQMRPSSADCPALLTAFRATGARLMYNSPVCGQRPRLRGQFSGIGISMGDFALALSPVVGRPVVDATTLTGPYDLDVTFAESDDPASVASLFTALQEQLGLRLEPQRAPVNVFVIDSVERPTPN